VNYHKQALEAVRILIEYLGDKATREGLINTPERVLKAWRQDWGAGYTQPPPVLTTFQDVAASGDHPMVLVRDIKFYSHCEHHMAPFFGTADVAYIPFDRVVGLSKIPRLVHHFARRLQVQERLTNQIADYLETGLGEAKVSCAVLMRATHTCMMSRGVREPDSTTTTTALRGAFRTDATVRAEFLQHVYALK
jgi:GTP cyclohydrolase I